MLSSQIRQRVAHEDKLYNVHRELVKRKEQNHEPGVYSPTTPTTPEAARRRKPYRSANKRPFGVSKVNLSSSALSSSLLLQLPHKPSKPIKIARKAKVVLDLWA